MDRTPTPLTPAEIDALLHDPRSSAADMLVLRDALDRMAGALARLAEAVGRMEEGIEGEGARRRARD
ncbi:MAG TPA: hypothetical protein VFX39_09465 [Gemmatimonadaceae bacterium]|jgi:hypothetical protein|nr:hypothetical protein [Gemmatimonadaceae bacterium]